MTRFHTLMSMSVLMAMGTAAPATATTHVLRPDGSGDFATIQAAVSAAVDGDVIELENGVYVGPGNRDIDVEGKAVTIRSQGGNAEACVLDCQGTEADPHRGFVLDSDEGPDTVLEGIAVASGHVQYVNGGAILCFDSSPTIRSCLFLGNVAPEGGGIACEGNSAFPVISQCRFVENHATNGGALSACSEARPQLIQCTFAQNFANEGGGVRLCYGSASIEECTFYANAAFTGSAIASESGHELAITNTIIAINVQGPAVSCSDEIELAVSCCDVFGNPGGDWVACLAGLLAANGNICEDPFFCDRMNGDLTLDCGSPCAHENNPDCGQIGAWPVGCGVTPATEARWGGIKAMFREHE